MIELQTSMNEILHPEFLALLWLSPCWLCRFFGLCSVDLGILCSSFSFPFLFLFYFSCKWIWWLPAFLLEHGIWTFYVNFFSLSQHFSFWSITGEHFMFTFFFLCRLLFEAAKVVVEHFMFELFFFFFLSFFLPPPFVFVSVFVRVLVTVWSDCSFAGCGCDQGVYEYDPQQTCPNEDLLLRLHGSDREKQ